MFLVVVLFFSVTCSAFPTAEDGMQCFIRCTFERRGRNASEDVADSMSVAKHNRARNVFKRAVHWLAKWDDLCDPILSDMKCSQSCTHSRLDAVMQQIILLVQEKCSPSVSDEQREQFLASSEELLIKLFDRAKRCLEPEPVDPTDDGAVCKIIDSCLFGSVVNELKGDYPADVVTFGTDELKLMTAQSLKDPESAPKACSFLYEPYKA